MLFNMKWSYLGSIALFLLGSLISGVAPDSVTLIIGRAIAGLGSAGILTGSFVVVAHAGSPCQETRLYGCRWSYVSVHFIPDYNCKLTRKLGSGSEQQQDLCLGVSLQILLAGAGKSRITPFVLNFHLNFEAP